ncbi:hypothetical protein QQZ08_002170 [Neonectria magnoliae]|uniref:Uncharacterized protein n=1 Tax=Neonectria magnoliae TaxID=2732573 RepID=A0ABR1IDQ4_9HYPO
MLTIVTLALLELLTVSTALAERSTAMRHDILIGQFTPQLVTTSTYPPPVTTETLTKIQALPTQGRQADGYLDGYMQLKQEEYFQDAKGRDLNYHMEDPFIKELNEDVRGYLNMRTVEELEEVKEYEDEKRKAYSIEDYLENDEIDDMEGYLDRMTTKHMDDRKKTGAIEAELAWRKGFKKTLDKEMAKHRAREKAKADAKKKAEELKKQKEKELKENWAKEVSEGLDKEMAGWKERKKALEEAKDKAKKKAKELAKRNYTPDEKAKSSAEADTQQTNKAKKNEAEADNQKTTKANTQMINEAKAEETNEVEEMNEAETEKTDEAEIETQKPNKANIQKIDEAENEKMDDEVTDADEAKDATAAAHKKMLSAAEEFSDRKINITQEWFSRPLNASEYYTRNWMWLRCRTTASLQFDAGGNWVNDYGRRFLKAMRNARGAAGPKCGPINWQFDYVNGQDWGDAHIGFDWFFMSCDQVTAIKAIMEAARLVRSETRRQLYLYNCPGFDQYPWSFVEWRKGANMAADQESIELDPAAIAQEKWFGSQGNEAAGRVKKGV